MLAIEAIHFFEPELFYSIYKNPKFFISHDKNPAIAIKLGFNKKAFNTDGAAFFKTLFAEHEDALELLSTLFPYVKRYSNGTDLEPDNLFSDPESPQISKQSRICSGKYFDLYFSYSSNNYIKIRENIESMINGINHLAKARTDKDIAEIAKFIQAHLFSLKKEDQKEWIERLQNHIPEINNEHLLAVAVSLYALIYYLDDSFTFFGYGLGARTRAEYVVSILLEQCSEKEFKEFLSLSKEDYSQLRVIYSIQQWMASEKIEGTDIRKARAAILLDHYTDMCNRISKGNICLFCKDYYYPKNVWGLYYHFKQDNNVASFSEYVAKNLSAENVYRVLWDITTTSVSDHYTYSINEENFGIFILHPEIVDQLLAQHPPKTKDEAFVLQIYNMFRTGEPDEWGYNGVTSPTDKSLKL